MSTKKDKFTLQDKMYMKFAINLAKTNDGITEPNPTVGCLVVKKNKIISYGVTNVNGRPHAETIALRKNRKNIAGSTVYLTLEPCSHFGLTPPCTNALIKAKVNKVIYSHNDIDSRSANRAKKILKSNNILSKSGLLLKETKKLYNRYIYTKKNKLPYVTGKLACSSNLYILKNKSFITNEHSRKISHLLRFKNQGLLTSYKTINSDNPKLTCRLNGLEKFSPTKIILDKDLKIKSNSFILKYKNSRKIIIFHNSTNSLKINYLKKKGAKLIYFKTNKENYFDLREILKKIYSLGICTLLVEAGKELTSKMISKELFNQFYLFKASKAINSTVKIKVFNIKNELDVKFKNKKIIDTYIDKDKLIHYY